MPRLKRVFRIIRYTFTALTVLVLLLVLWAWWRWNTQPSYWHVTEPGGQQTAEQAERFEFWVTSQATAVRDGDGRWSADVEVQQINQWLVERSKQWLANQHIAYPDWLSDPMVALEPNRLIVAGHVQRDDFDNILSLVYEPIPARGDVPAMLDLTEIRVGSLGIPADMVLDKVLRGYSPDDAAKIQRAIQHVTLQFPVDGGRELTIEQLHIDAPAGTVTVDCRTVRK